MADHLNAIQLRDRLPRAHRPQRQVVPQRAQRFAPRQPASGATARQQDPAVVAERVRFPRELRQAIGGEAKPMQAPEQHADAPAACWTGWGERHGRAIDPRIDHDAHAGGAPQRSVGSRERSHRRHARRRGRGGDALRGAKPLGRAWGAEQRGIQLLGGVAPGGRGQPPHAMEPPARHGVRRAGGRAKLGDRADLRDLPFIHMLASRGRSWHAWPGRGADVASGRRRPPHATAHPPPPPSGAASRRGAAPPASTGQCARGAGGARDDLPR